jgi:nucleotide-binding universal stress UspA family protein
VRGRFFTVSYVARMYHHNEYRRRLMNSTMLVPLDGSACAEAVIPHAIAFAQAKHHAITLFRVIEAPNDAERLAIPEDRKQAMIYLAYIADQLRALGLVVQTVVVEGNPAERIVALAAAQPQCAAIAMATHGRRGPRRWVFGSVAEAVLHAAPVPVLLVRANDYPTPPLPDAAYRNVLVPLDGSAFAERAVAEAQSVAHASGATLHLLAVVDTPVEHVSAEDTAAAEVGVVPAWMLADAYAHSESVIAVLEHTAQRLRAQGLTVETAVVRGKPAEQIVHVAADEQIDLVVMATHGRTAMSRMWFGSVAMGVMQHLHRPLLLIRPPSHTRPVEEYIEAGVRIHAID